MKRVNSNKNYFVNRLSTHNRPGCFIFGTMVGINGGTKPIEEIMIGDEVLSFNEETKNQEYNVVTDIRLKIHNDFVRYHIGSDIKLTSTWDCPIYINDYVLSSYDPIITNSKYDLPKHVRQIQSGDIVHTSWEEIEGIKKIEQLPSNQTQTYMISVDGNHNFYVNGILVHTK